MLRGVWDEPLMLLDTQSLIRRAPAAAPLSMRSATALARSALGHRPAGRHNPAAPAAARTDDN